MIDKLQIARGRHILCSNSHCRYLQTLGLFEEINKRYESLCSPSYQRQMRTSFFISIFGLILMLMFSPHCWALEEWIIREQGFHESKEPERSDVLEYAKSIRNFKNRGSDGEHVDAMFQYFHGKLNGTALELGAVDGTRISETRAFVPLGWKRILIEADPNYRDALLAKHETKTFSVNAAICANMTQLHYIRRNMIGGIIEFFSEGQIEREFPQLLRHRSAAGIWDWEAINQDKANLPVIVPVDCLPLAAVLERAGVRHVDFMVLDTEGSELSVLESIDFSQVTFDVIVVETETLHGFRSPDFLSKVETLLKSKGYSAAASVCGRNTWFARDGFEPSTAPFAEKGCFRGAITACKMRAMAKEAEEFEKHCTTTTSN